MEGRDHTSGSDFIATRTKQGERGPDIELSGATVEDQDFIAHARQDLEDLVCEVRRLQKELAALRTILSDKEQRSAVLHRNAVRDSGLLRRQDQ